MQSKFKSFEELPVILTVKDVQQVLGISRVTAYDLVKSEGFPCIKVSERRLVIVKEKFIQWLEKQAS